MRGSPIKELEQVIGRGFSLHMSIEGLTEIWCRSIREDRYEQHMMRLGRLSNLVDAEAPIAFVGGALLGQIGEVPKEVSDDGAEFRNDVMGGWRSLVREKLTRPEWQRIGERLQTELDSDERSWKNHIDEAKRLTSERRHMHDRVGFEIVSHRRWEEALIGGLIRGARARTRPALECRAALHLRYYAAKLANARERQPSSNDFSDARHLQHVAWPAFLMTTDFRLLEAVDSTGSNQRAWVRCPVELAEDGVCRCEPWGKSLARCIPFERQSIDALKERQERYRDGLQ